jgi:hypothetical protein
MTRRTFLRRTGALAFAPSLAPSIGGGDSAPPAGGETLYNGIRLGRPWPPRQLSFPSEPALPAYLADPPPVIPIDVGRQLFVDDFLIEETTLTRIFHSAEYYSGNPILRPTTAWEKRDEYAERTNTRSNPAAIVFSDGVFYDPKDQLFKMWYMGGYSQNVCYAVSQDGLGWERPSLDVVPGTNITLSIGRDSSTVWLDLFERDPAVRYKMAISRNGQLRLYTSPDGIHWHAAGSSGPVGDRTTFFYNPFRAVWVFSIRDEVVIGTRSRRYWETRDFVRGASWQKEEPVPWTAADRLDPRRPEYNVPAQLYNLDAVAYESLIVGLFTIWRGERNVREKPNDIVVGYSRDGFHWHRPDRRPFLPVSERMGDWNWANVQSAGGVCLVVGDRLYFYVSGRRGVPGTNDPGVCSTGVATLRRDGFASLVDPGESAPVRRVTPGRTAPASVTTRPIRFSGGVLFVNADARGGEVRAEVLDEQGRTIQPFSAARCRAVRADGTRIAVTWDGGPLRQLTGQTVRFRFYVTRGQLFSFWVSANERGASRGYVAAGGPGFTSPIDGDPPATRRERRAP